MLCICLAPTEDVMMETVVEVSTECGPIEEESFPIPPDCEPAVKKKRGGEYSLDCSQKHKSGSSTEPSV